LTFIITKIWQLRRREKAKAAIANKKAVFYSKKSKKRRSPLYGMSQDATY
jgi:hypothetical protein